MRQRGRVSQASLAVVAERPGTLAGGDRPAPPAHLTAAETAEWWAIVDRLDSEWFPRETHGLLAALCAVKVQLDEINRGMASFGPGLPKNEKRWKRYREMTRMRGALGTQLASLSTKLRLTPQSRYDRDRAGAAARRPDVEPDHKPWNDDATPH